MRTSLLVLGTIIVALLLMSGGLGISYYVGQTGWRYTVMGTGG